jgi:hypothetical protein
MNPHTPYHPIVYVRGFAATAGEIEETVADPYMGFNLGSTKIRQAWTGELKKFFFESPMMRLNTDHDYDDAFVDGEDLIAADPLDPAKPARRDIALPYRSVIIYRYYDEASEAFGSGKTPPIEHFAAGLSDLILRLRTLVCRAGKHPITGQPLDNKVSEADFRVYLVAHSMGGLVCRAFLQNPRLGDAAARGAVDKLFTYATPHNGIDLRIVRNVPGWASFGDVSNFNRERMAKYLALPPSAASKDDVSEVRNFPPERIFNLVGTNPNDYTVLGGVSSWAAGPQSDGLVRIDNATTHGPAAGADVSSPRAFVHRSHSGHYGIVNSEEGYQNLTRFLFGSVRVDGILDVDEITLPTEVQTAFDKGKKIRASYQFEVVVSVRGCQWQMHRRLVRENSAIFRTYDELFPEARKSGKRTPDRSRSPHLFSLFLDPKKSTRTNGSVSFAFDLAVLVPDYEVDGLLFLDRHYEGGYIYRELLIVEAVPDAKALGGWRLHAGTQSQTPNTTAPTPLVTQALPNRSGIVCEIPVVQPKPPGLKATLRLEARPWA